MSHSAITALEDFLRPQVSLGKSRLETLCLLIVGIVGARTVNLGHVACERGGSVRTASTYRRLQRFFQHVRLGEDWALRGFDRAVQITGYGLPLGMLASGYAFFLARPAADPFVWTPLGFVAGAALAIVLGLREPDTDALGARCRRLLGLACLALPVLRMATGGMDWAAALLASQSDVLSVDLSLLVAGACLLRRGAPAARPVAIIPGPAE